MADGGFRRGAGARPGDRACWPGRDRENGGPVSCAGAPSAGTTRARAIEVWMRARAAARIDARSQGRAHAPVEEEHEAEEGEEEPQPDEGEAWGADCSARGSRR